MTDTIKNANMPTKESEHPPATTTITAAAAVDDESITGEGTYFCECCLCICGASVEYPGDVCYVCSKYH